MGEVQLGSAAGHGEDGAVVQPSRAESERACRDRRVAVVGVRPAQDQRAVAALGDPVDIGAVANRAADGEGTRLDGHRGAARQRHVAGAEVQIVAADEGEAAAGPGHIYPDRIGRLLSVIGRDDDGRTAGVVEAAAR